MNISKLLLTAFVSLILSFGNMSVLAFSSRLIPNSNISQRQNMSINWSGYSATGGVFTGIAGTWTIPKPSGNNFGADATWVGIGGVTSHDLIQAGTQAIVGGNGQVFYESFFETLPNPSEPLPIVVNGGDSITVSVIQQSKEQWLINFKNNTSGQGIQISQPYVSSLSSAEWIEESPSGMRHIVSLDNFGSVQFSNATALLDGKTVNLIQSNAKPITMTNFSGQPLVTTSSIGSDELSFSVLRSINQSTQQFTPRRMRSV